MVWTANTKVYNSEQNVDRAVSAALDIAVPHDFKSGGAATNGWSGDMAARDIIANLKETYGKPGPADKAKIEAIFMKPYNPSRPIESMLKELETARMMSILAKIPYTMEQLLDKALTKIQVTNQFRNALVDWATYVADDTINNNNWTDFKDHFIQAYTVNQAALTMAQAGYHSAANANKDYNDDDFRLHLSQLSQHPDSQQCICSSYQQPTNHAHRKHSTTICTARTANGHVGCTSPAITNDAPTHANAIFRTSTAPRPDGPTTIPTTSRAGIHPGPEDPTKQLHNI